MRAPSQRARTAAALAAASYYSSCLHVVQQDVCCPFAKIQTDRQKYARAACLRLTADGKTQTDSSERPQATLRKGETEDSLKRKTRRRRNEQDAAVSDAVQGCAAGADIHLHRGRRAQLGRRAGARVPGLASAAAGGIEDGGTWL